MQETPLTMSIKTMTKLKVDIVVPVFNALDCVKECLESILSANLRNIEIKTLIIDDCSNNETKEFLENFVSKNNNFLLIRNNTNLGYTKSLNKGIKEGNSEIIMQLNSDCILSKNSVEKITHSLIKNNFFAVSPMSNAASWQSIPKVLEEDGTMAVNTIPENFSINEMDSFCESYGPGMVKSQLLNGFCIAYQRHMLEGIGFADELKFPKGYGEEDDLHLRAANNGYNCAINTQAYVFHQKTKSFSSVQKNELTRLGRNQLNKDHGDLRIKSITSGLRFHPKLEYIRLASSNIIDKNSYPISKYLKIDWKKELLKHRTVNLISIVMPVYRHAEMTSECIKSLYKSASIDFELVVVLNGADESCTKAVQELQHEFGFKVVTCENNLFFSMGCNMGSLHTKGDKILFLNNDMLFEKNGWLESMKINIQKNNIGCSSIKLFYDDYTLQSGGFIWSKKSFFPIEPFKRHQANELTGNYICDGVTGACLMINASDFFKIKGYDPLYINGSEDIDLCLKVRFFLYKKSIVDYDNHAFHLESKSPGRSDNIMHNRKIFFQKWSSYINKISCDIEDLVKKSDDLPSPISMSVWKTI